MLGVHSTKTASKKIKLSRFVLSSYFSSEFGHHEPVRLAPQSQRRLASNVHLEYKSQQQTPPVPEACFKTPFLTFILQMSLCSQGCPFLSFPPPPWSLGVSNNLHVFCFIFQCTAQSSAPPCRGLTRHLPCLIEQHSLTSNFSRETRIQHRSGTSFSVWSCLA